jgi:hypothetical protein
MILKVINTEADRTNIEISYTSRKNAGNEYTTQLFSLKLSLFR